MAWKDKQELVMLLQVSETSLTSKVAVPLAPRLCLPAVCWQQGYQGEEQSDYLTPFARISGGRTARLPNTVRLPNTPEHLCLRHW